MKSIRGRSVVMIVASHDFRDEELKEPYTLLLHAGAAVKVASSRLSKMTGMLGTEVFPDMLVDDVDVMTADAVVFVGGSGAQEYFENPAALRIAREAVRANRWVGAICIAPAILANAGVLDGREAACFPSVAPLLRKNGAHVPARDTVRDGRIITASGPHVAREFGQALLEALAE